MGKVTKLIFSGSVFLLFFMLIKIAKGSPTPEGEGHDTSTLKLVVMLHRHGYRTPTSTFKNDPHKESAWPVPMGTLMKVGKKQMYDIGTIYRQRYLKFINKYSSKMVKVRSSDMDRCIMSTQLMLAGWFPPTMGNEEEMWDDNLLWQPIPVHTVPPVHDNMLIQHDAPCPKYKAEKEKYLAELKRKETPEDKKLYQELSQHMGEEITKLAQIEVFFMAFTIEEKFNKPFPDWVKNYYPEKMAPKVQQSREAWAPTTYMRKMTGGVFVKELLQHFTNKKEGKNGDLKLFIYSAHDSTMWSVWQALNFNNYFWPDYGSAFIFELHQEGDKYTVKFLHQKDTKSQHAEEVAIPNCSSPCTLDTLLEVTKEVRPDNWEADCKL